MKTKTVEMSSTTLKELAELTQSEPVIVLHEGAPAYAIVPLDELDYEAWILSENPDFMALIEHSRERYRQEGGVPLEEVRRQLGLPAREE